MNTGVVRHQNLERLFLRYRRKGCPTALGRVFDATAPHLLRVAGHLAGDREEAEDLLQETFLVAIQKADRWNEEQPLLPWLFGILANLARRARRRGSRSPDPDRLPTTESPSPPETLARSEIRHAIEQALADLTEPYRRVLTLHLGEGLGANEVAERLSCSPSTVRTQIKRGLARLRKSLPVHALPAVMVSPRENLEGIRRAVIAEARNQTGPTPGIQGESMSLDWLSTPWIITGTLVTTLVVVLGIAVSGVWSPPSPQGDRGATGESRPAPVADALRPPRDQVSARVAVDTDDSKSANGGIELPPHPLVQVQIVERSTGRPLPEAELSWWSREPALGGFIPWPAGAEVFSQDGFEEGWRVLLSNREDYLGGFGPIVRADDQGMVEVPLASGHTLLRARSGNLLGRGASFGDADHLVGVPGCTPLVLELDPTRQVRVQVVGPDGSPRAGVPVAVLSDVDEVLWLGETVGADGSAEVTLAPEAWRRTEDVASVTIVPAILGETEGFELDLGHPPDQLIVLTLPETGEIITRIEDRHGRPNRDRVTIHVGHDRGSGAEPMLRYLVVEATGDEFTLPYVALGQHFEFEAWRTPHAERFSGRAFSVIGPARPGETVAARIQLPEESPTLRGKIVDDEGRPAADRSFRIEEDYPNPWLHTESTGAFTWRPGGNGSDLFEGPRQSLTVTRWETTDVHGTPRGAVGVLDLPVPLPPTELDLGVITLQSPEQVIAGVVVDPEGNPIPNAIVGAPGDLEFANVAAVTTDAEGRFEMRGTWPEPLRVEVDKDGWCSMGEASCWSGDRAVELVLHRGGSIKFRLQHDPQIGFLPCQASLHRQGREGSVWHSLPDGDFTLLTPGTYKVSLTSGSLLVAEVDNVIVRSGATTDDPRLNPLDLTGRLRTMAVRLRHEDGRIPHDLRIIGLDDQGETAYRATHRSSGDERFTLFLKQETSQVEVVAAGCRSVVLPCDETETSVVLEPGLTVLIATPYLPEGVRAIPSLVSVRNSVHVSSPEAIAGGWRFQVPSPGRYQLEWTVARTIGTRTEKGRLNPLAPAFLVVEDRTEEQRFEPEVSADDLARPLRSL